MDTTNALTVGVSVAVSAMAYVLGRMDGVVAGCRATIGALGRHGYLSVTRDGKLATVAQVIDATRRNPNIELIRAAQQEMAE